jgi:glyoxylase-like metal-dependent hydrolase (beta-lactamase superfamily II)
MSEPKNRARKVTEVVPGVLHWTLHDNRIDFRSDAHAVQEQGRTILIDPLPLVEEALADLSPIEAILLTGSCHERSAWRYRKQFGVKVYAPAGAEELGESADEEYRKGDKLPGGLVAVHAPGPTEVHYAFLLELAGGVLFCADILVNKEGELEFVPDKYMDEPHKTRETARGFLDLQFATLCFDHGAPMTEGGREAIERLLAKRASG